MDRVTVDKKGVMEGPLLETDILLQLLLDDLPVDIKSISKDLCEVDHLLFAHLIEAQGHFLQPACLFKKDLHISLDLGILIFQPFFFDELFEAASKTGCRNGWVLEVMKYIVKTLHPLGFHEFSAQKQQYLNLFFGVALPLVQGIESHEVGDFFTHVQGDIEDGVDAVVGGKSLNLF